jgi:hypothetical protein
MIFCTALFQATGVEYMTVTQELHPSIFSHHCSQKEKFQDSAFCWEMLVHCLLVLQWHHSSGVQGHRYKNKLRDLCEGNEEEDGTNCVHCGRKPMHQRDNTGSHTGAATSVVIA